MNILLINHYAGSLEHGMEYRPFYFAREWVRMGHTVNIISADFSHLRVKNPTIENDFESEVIEGVNYYWVKSINYQGNGAKRALSMFKFVLKLYLNAKKIAKKLKPNVVIASSTYPLDTFAAQRIAKLSKAKLVHEIHDMWPLTLTEIGGMSKCNPFVVVMQIAENSFSKNSDIVVSILPKTKKYLMTHGMKEESFHYIPNGIVKGDWDKHVDMPQEHSDVLGDLKNKHKFIVGYFGGHALSNALYILLEVAENIDIAEIHFVLVGDGVEKKNLQRLAQEKSLDNITFMPSVPKLSVPKLLENFDCIYIGGESHSLYRFGVGLNKLYDSMMAGKPIIYALDSANDDVANYKCGISVKSGDVKEIINAVKCLYNVDNKTRQEIGSRGKKAVLENYEYTILAKKFENILKSIIS